MAIDNDTNIPDLGRAASAGFQGQANAAGRPYVRDDGRRPKPVDGGGFQNTIKRDEERAPFAIPIAHDE